jgi:hypothetical protein
MSTQRLKRMLAGPRSERLRAHTNWSVGLYLVILTSSGPAISDMKLSTPVLLVYPAVANRALSAQQIKERTHSRPDGTVTRETIESMIYRDGAGRMRIEWSIQGTRVPVVYLLDPVARSVVILLSEARTANRHILPEPVSGEFRVGFPAVGETLPEGKWHTKIESIGADTIGGFAVIGTRTTVTSEDEPPLVRHEDRWVCKDVGFVPMVTASGPNWKHSVRIQNVRRVEPDPTLFVIPPDYVIQG